LTPRPVAKPVSAIGEEVSRLAAVEADRQERRFVHWQMAELASVPPA
jgi:hypothetical protein